MNAHTQRVDYSTLIREDAPEGFLVHSRLYLDEAIFEDEIERIYHRGWVYVGHESELPKVGDYRLRLIGRQPVIMVRGEDQRIRLLLNRCTHRGNTICQRERGNTKFFRCAYHDWVFDNTGALREATHVSGWGDRPPGEAQHLFEVPRMGVHRGFIFASLVSDGVSFEDYLGNAAAYLSRYCDLAPGGEIDLSAGRHGITVDANWKMQLENLTDAYHAEYVHASALAQFASLSSTDKKAAFTDRGDLENPLAMQRDLGGGHSVLDSFTSNRAQGDKLRFTGSTGTLLPEVIEGVAQRIGSHEKAQWLARGGPCHIMVFPNLMLLWDAVRVIQPVAHSVTHIYYHPALLKGASEAVNIARIRAQEGGFGPAGFLAPDDMEMFERSQAGMAVRPDTWLELNRGRHIERIEDDDFGQPVRTCQNLDEVAQRGIWRHYKTVMTAE
ncbi:aromatic ring-hydroxylating dioxygenase subunit alpha [Immundisolibacter sp.]|uniref:aromatic ring-hydroxylating oxygenase subunit alpha n=1 Tax=Immundisolibacter sp. TaxID=1934948 RepID=UPI003567A121